MQCGADSLSYDKLGDFCLTTKGHGEAVNHIKKFNLPILLVGGGTDFYNKYGPDYKLHIKVKLVF